MTSAGNANNSFDFSTVLAAAVHDMKNSLNLLVQSVELIASSLPDELTETKKQVVDLHYEANRMNTALVQVLSLYRADQNNLPVVIDQCFIGELINDIVMANTLYASQKKITIESDDLGDLVWYLDSDLLYLLINDVVINALRYSRSKIHIRAFERDGYVVISIQDDGSGYPEHMLVKDNATLSDFNITQGRTGLGLYFAHLIAHAHVRDDKHGLITLANGGDLGGGVFEVNIP